jgi:hypothetical protein
MAQVTLLHLHRRFACRNQRSCLGAYVPCLISQCAVPHKSLQQQQVLHPQSRAGLRWHGWCFYVFALPSIRCKPCCVPHSAPLKLFLEAHNQRMLVSVGALRRMLLAIACLGHLQQRPGSNLPQLRAGVLQWLTSPGLPAERR